MNKLIILVVVIQASLAFAGIQELVTLKGTLVSMDSKNVVLKDKSGTKWQINRTVLMSGYPLTTGQPLNIQVPKGDLVKLDSKGRAPTSH